MIFSNREIELAKQIKGLGIPWTPAVGHFMYDTTDALDEPTPFQNRVYFMFDRDHFLELLGGVDNVKKMMVWLPTWSDARDILRDLGVDDEEVELELVRRSAIAKGAELSTIYEMIAQQLSDARLQAIYHRL